MNRYSKTLTKIVKKYRKTNFPEHFFTYFSAKTITSVTFSHRTITSHHFVYQIFICKCESLMVFSRKKDNSKHETFFHDLLFKAL